MKYEKLVIARYKKYRDAGFGHKVSESQALKWANKKVGIKKPKVHRKKRQSRSNSLWSW